MKILIAVTLTLFCTLSALAQTQAQVMVTEAYLRKSPDLTAEKVHSLKKGDKVTLENAQDTNGWILASVSKGRIKGWIRKEFVRSLETTAETPKQPQQIQPAQSKPTQNQPVQNRAAQNQPTRNQTAQNQPTQNQNRQRIATTPVQTPAAVETPNSTPTPTEETAPNPTSSSAPADSDSSPIEDNEVLRIETAEVNLTVRVLDDKNRPVNNLSQSDFKVYEDGVLQPITSISTAEVPIVNALVIDNSRSLRSQLSKVIEAGKILVGANRPDDQSAVVRFVSTDKIEMMQDFTPNKAALGNALDNLFIEGGQTAIVDAVYQTAKNVEQYQNTGKNEDVKIRTLILVTDGDDRGSRMKEQQLIELLRQLNVQIYAVGFVNALSREPDTNGINRQEKARAFLTRLAQETGGKVYFPDSIEELPKIAKDISSEQRTQYLISYAPTNETRDTSFRKIKVEVSEGANKEKRTAIARTGRNTQQQ
ncbi:MAG: VWA domain-containing protein [Acidobacteriota bacterium]|nr:VWA domain-containing protein [Acidobacteriota bacterium]